MKVLILVTDLFRNIGGGQTVYRKIIEQNPHIHFSYFIEKEPINLLRPKNANAIPLLPATNLKDHSPILLGIDNLGTLQEVNRFARSVSGQEFDIVEFPDFYVWGDVFRSAFHHHRVKVGRFVLAMHGNISTSQGLNWGSDKNDEIKKFSLEEEQFDSVDGIYSISKRYIEEWAQINPRNIHYLDPVRFVTAINPSPIVGFYEEKPSLCCIGRMERRKGNDLFIDILRWLREDSFGRAMHIGDHDGTDRGSSYILGNMAKARNIEFEYLPAFDRGELNALFRKKIIVILPVRYDTLNLTAMEALFSGCPLVVSSRAGCCDYFDEVYPGLPYVKIDFDNFYGSIAEIQWIIDHYEDYRKKILDFLIGNPIAPPEGVNIGNIYDSILAEPPRRNDNKHFSIQYDEIKIGSLPSFKSKMAKSIIAPKLYLSLRKFYRTPKKFLVESLRPIAYTGDDNFFSALCDARWVPSRIRYIATLPENSPMALRKKLNSIYESAGSPLYRCNFWAKIARIERILGNDLIAVAYELRILRLLRRDPSGLLPLVSETLLKHGFVKEAEAAEVMFGDQSDNSDRIYDYIKETFKRNLFWTPRPFELIVDRRRGTPKVSVIVSLYKAAGKLPLFLRLLSRQTLTASGAFEVIFVDSGSPDNEHEVIDNFMKKNLLNAVYARSSERETIQSAWNRGIELSGAPYLVFLGADETLYPEALEVLASELDANPDVDWVMADSLVTEVDENGALKKDVMTYDRSGGTKDHVYLETCYLSYVGGMYRKSIHNRFGYYDETFGAAGDTEFKNRILPNIHVKFIPRTLGLFLNYPDERTTASPRAEIEDLRAWYIHRTLGGVKYAFENRNVEEVEKLLCKSLGYRKSYCGHLSCDVEYATYLSQYVQKRSPSSRVCKIIEPGLSVMLSNFRKMEITSTASSKMEVIGFLLKVWRTAYCYQRIHGKLLGSSSQPRYMVLNDNRYEQHSWLWKSKL